MIKIYLKSILITSIPTLLGVWFLYCGDNALVILIAPIVGFSISWSIISKHVDSKVTKVKLFFVKSVFLLLDFRFSSSIMVVYRCC